MTARDGGIVSQKLERHHCEERNQHFVRLRHLDDVIHVFFQLRVGVGRDADGLEDVKSILLKRFEQIDYTQAKRDVMPFIRTPASLDIWSYEFFRAITEKLTAI